MSAKSSKIPVQSAPVPVPIVPTINTRIVVLDRGFVYVGVPHEEGDNLVIENARNIRYWGTTKGLGELISGPTASTKLDVVGTVIAPKRALIHQIVCTANW